MRPFRFPVTILNTIDHLGKFDGKADEGLFVGYSTNGKAFRVFNSRTRIVEENLHVKFREDTPNIAGRNQSNGNAGTKACNDIGKTRREIVPGKDNILLPMWPADPLFSQDSKSSPYAGFKPLGEEEKKDVEVPRNEDSEVLSTEESRFNQEKDASVNSTNIINTVSPTVNAAGIEDNAVDENIVYGCADAPYMPELEEICRFSDAEDDISGAGINNLDTYFQMDVKSVFLYGKIEQEVYVCQPPGFKDSDFPDIVYKVEKALYGLHQAPRAWYETLSTYLLDNGFQRGKIDKTLFIKRDKSDILLVQVYVDDMIFGFTRKKICTEFEKMMHKKFQMSSMGELTFFLGLQVRQKEDGIFISQDKPDIMFAVCAYARFKVNPKSSHLHAVKRIFRYLKGQPKLGLWYPKDSPFDLVAYTDSDYAGASLDRKSTTRGCQFLGCRLILWQCKKQTVVANSKTEAEYIAASNCCGQVLWIQNQLLDYGYNFMQTKIHIDNESTICIVKNPVFTQRQSTLRLGITLSEILMRRSLFR
ncbi:putative ribonuclease H-like domain-containing protein [Tanacetum coccineum]|uniref:Ribonuclease H-like domain-containing protein n=1 Tax=Tanacetum coccineum TaxID=301880 RepID=A0ABQ4YMZ8_9ASTR